MINFSTDVAKFQLENLYREGDIWKQNASTWLL